MHYAHATMGPKLIYGSLNVRLLCGDFQNVLKLTRNDLDCYRSKATHAQATFLLHDVQIFVRFTLNSLYDTVLW